MVEIKEQLDSLSDQVARLKGASSNGETKDDLIFEQEFQFPNRSVQDLKRVEEKLSSSLAFRKYLTKYIQNRASFPLLGNLSAKEQKKFFKARKIFLKLSMFCLLQCKVRSKQLAALLLICQQSNIH
ncbi:uncharacterized protein LOC124172705 [Ischnura elegans]|uniref:uncharacterized protein LOC124171397 n=1 Tax=Ischnura elegans TaxID=197161 RepID=UPI001ED8902B|nr:uncharacterized protein LOC124171397 [Ischnura elegans]XP_046408129.1 uncharacterized protein LOC124172705 [Ischnura elegans]